MQSLYFPEIPATWIHILAEFLVSFISHLLKMSFEDISSFSSSLVLYESLVSVFHTELKKKKQLFFFFAVLSSMWNLSPWPGIEPVPPAVEVQC